MKKATLIEYDKDKCKQRSLALRDAIELLGGKWKICILQALSFDQMQFKDLQETVIGISPKVLSNELKDLEQNQLVIRTVNNTRPITVSYALTKHAYSTKPVIQALLDFGSKHRAIIIGT